MRIRLSTIVGPCLLGAFSLGVVVTKRRRPATRLAGPMRSGPGRLPTDGEPDLNDLLNQYRRAVKSLTTRLIAVSVIFPSLTLIIVETINNSQEIMRNVRQTDGERAYFHMRWILSGSRLELADAVVINIGLVALIAAINLGLSSASEHEDMAKRIRSVVWVNAMRTAAAVAAIISLAVATVVWVTDRPGEIWLPATTVTGLAILALLVAMNTSNGPEDDLDSLLLRFASRQRVDKLRLSAQRGAQRIAGGYVPVSRSSMVRRVFTLTLGWEAAHAAAFTVIWIIIARRQRGNLHFYLAWLWQSTTTALAGFFFVSLSTTLVALRWIARLKEHRWHARAFLVLNIGWHAVPVSFITVLMVQVPTLYAAALATSLIVLWLVLPDFALRRAWSHGKGWALPVLTLIVGMLQRQAESASDFIPRSERPVVATAIGLRTASPR
jgi:hypothetical protein